MICGSAPVPVGGSEDLATAKSVQDLEKRLEEKLKKVESKLDLILDKITAGSAALPEPREVAAKLKAVQDDYASKCTRGELAKTDSNAVCAALKCEKTGQVQCPGQTHHQCEAQQVLESTRVGMEWTHRHFKSFNLAAIEKEEKERKAEEEALRDLEADFGLVPPPPLSSRDTVLVMVEGGESSEPVASEPLLPADSSTSLARASSSGTESEWMKGQSESRKHRLDLAKRYRAALDKVCFNWEHVEHVVMSHKFEHFVGAIVLANAVATGIETDYMVRAVQTPFWVQLMGYIFCGIFCTELALRIVMNPVRFFDPHHVYEFGWNLFDVVVVTFQVADCFVEDKGTFAHLSIFRMCRIFRILRLVRVVRFFEELRTLLNSMAESFESLFWALIVLLGLMYICAVMFCQILADAELEAKEGGAPFKQDLHRWFGSMGTSLLTLFEAITGAIAWSDIFDALVADIGIISGIGFLMYVITSLFAVTNAVTSVFVDKMSNISAQDKEIQMAHQLKDLFFKKEEDATNDVSSDHDKITFEKFQAICVAKPAMKDFFQNLNVDLSEAEEVFNLLDIDGSKEVDREELVNGCLRLSGPAKALDVALVMRQNKILIKMLEGVNSHHKFNSMGSRVSVEESPRSLGDSK